MARPPRNDAPGVFHHVWNRGIGRRTMFEFHRDTRRFLAELAREVHKEHVRVHAYALMSNHFHLLLESVSGGLSDCMRQVQGTHGRCFNLPRDRLGTLLQGRFKSRRVQSTSDRLTLVCYIDRNPVEARLARHGAFYPHGSASHYARLKGPPWLERSWVESIVRASRGLERYEPSAYSLVFQRGMSGARVEWVEERIRAGDRGPDPLDDLIRRAPPAVRHWLEERANLADGTGAVVPIVPPSVILDLVRDARSDGSEWGIGLRPRTPCAWCPLTVALLRDLAGETYHAISLRIEKGRSATKEAYVAHRELLKASAEYAERAGQLAHDAVQRCHGWLRDLL
jgi:REP element-mobilizing transposase RayT